MSIFLIIAWTLILFRKKQSYCYLYIYYIIQFCFPFLNIFQMYFLLY